MRNCHRLEETKKTQQLTAMWGLGLKTGTEKKPAIGPKKGIGQEKPRPSN